MGPLGLIIRPGRRSSEDASSGNGNPPRVGSSLATKEDRGETVEAQVGQVDGDRLGDACSLRARNGSRARSLPDGGRHVSRASHRWLGDQDQRRASAGTQFSPNILLADNTTDRQCRSTHGGVLSVRSQNRITAEPILKGRQQHDHHLGWPAGSGLRRRVDGEIAVCGGGRLFVYAGGDCVVSRRLDEIQQCERTSGRSSPHVESPGWRYPAARRLRRTRSRQIT